MKPKPKPSLIILIIITVISVSLSPASLVFAEEQGTTCIDDPLLQDEIIPEESNPETTPEEMVFETCASESVGSPQSDAAEAESILEEADTEGVNVDPEDIENKIEDISVEIHPVAEAEQVDSNIEISYSSAFSSDDSFERLAAPAVTVENYGESDRKLKISWSSVYGADGYFVYRSTKKGSGYKLITREEIRYSYVDDGLMPNTAYYYKVKAFRYEEPGDRLYRIEDPYYPGALSSAKRIKTKRTVSDGRDFDKASYRFIDYTSYRKKDVTVTRATDSAAKSIYKLLKKGKNFTVYVKKKDLKSARSIMNSLVKKVRRLSDARIGFRYTKCYGSGKLKYHLFEVDALEYKYVRKYIKMAYKERMAAYKEYVGCGCSPDYYTEKGVYYGPSFICSPFECPYGTPFKELSTESLLLFILPSTKHVVGCDYMAYNNWTYDTNTLGISGFIRLCNKSANGVCSNFADMTKQLCDYLGIQCWYVDSCYDLFHSWAIAKVKTETGESVYYYIDTGIAFQIESADCLGAGQQKAVKAAMKKSYPW